MLSVQFNHFIYPYGDRQWEFHDLLFLGEKIIKLDI